NLHGIDIDARAIQIAAAALWLRAKLHAPDARLSRMNLVAPNFRLAALPKDDPARVALETELAQLGVPRETTTRLVDALKGVDHLGTLLRVDRDIGALLDEQEREEPLFAHAARKHRARLEAHLASFLDAHAAESDLGLRLEGEQLAAGVRFVELAKDGRYDVVVGNPPYHSTSKLAESKTFSTICEEGRADLFASFFVRCLELARVGGACGLVTLSNWMSLGAFEGLRARLLRVGISLIADFGKSAFGEGSQLISTSATLLRPHFPRVGGSVALRTFENAGAIAKDQPTRTAAALLAQVGRYEFDPKAFAVIDGEPIVYWWTKEFLDRYAAAPKLGDVSSVRSGAATSDNTRFLRRWFEVAPTDGGNKHWAPYIKGADGSAWCDPSSHVVRWDGLGLQPRVYAEHGYGSYSRQIKNEHWYFKKGIAFTAIGANFSARLHLRASVFDVMGQSIFPPAQAIAGTLCAMNRSIAKEVLQSLNPTIHFQVSDVERLSLFAVEYADTIVSTIVEAFRQHEAAREPSRDFNVPASSPWRCVQQWAQLAVDRPEGAPLPPYAPEYDRPDPEAHVSFAIGVALGRFGASGEGILDTAPNTALPTGILFVAPNDAYPDALTHPSLAPLLAAWDAFTPASGKKPPLRDWLRKDFFAYHKALYENRPIYFPLSGEKKSFVAWVSIHRFTDATLATLLADHLHPVLRQLDAEIHDANTTRASSDKKAAIAAGKAYDTVKRLRDELADFIAAVSHCAERGAPPTDPACPPREVDASFSMDLDDGVMINSAALWPLLSPQWSDPKKWWKQLCAAEGKKDYDWAHLAKRYFPSRADAKCKEDPSLAVAHHCFWRYHPAKSYAWELRLQDEIREGFTIDEPGSDEARAAYLRAHAAEAEAAREKERVRRLR
ncbi:BREX-6 system adenine-specific DNA-methyltransferase PglX, partial [Gemmatimonas sp.]|uniref:BREX-6 system adenine-specific DNA-methyltransferase PglX n=1 Tax=Gemmatimonas sp. TaxID=1962908 RepID=UPI0039831D89